MEMKGNERARLVDAGKCTWPPSGFKGQIIVGCLHVLKALSPQLVMKHGTGNYLI